jgi:hypothetical protein
VKPIEKNPFANPVLPDGRVVRPGDRLRRQQRQDPKERAARNTQSSRRSAERQRLAMRVGTDKTDPLYKAKIEREELIEQTAAKGRRAQRELAEAMIEQARMRRLGDEAAAILAVNAGLTTDMRDYLAALSPDDWPVGSTYAEQDDVERARRLADVFKAAGVPDRQARAWVLDRVGMPQSEIGSVMGRVKRSNINELVAKAHAKLLGYTVGRVSGVAMADRIIAEDRAARAARGPFGQASLQQAHGGGTVAAARSVGTVPVGGDADVQDVIRRANKRRKGGGRRSTRDEG